MSKQGHLQNEELVAMLDRAKLELSEINRNIAELQRRREALLLIVSGVERIAGPQGIERVATAYLRPQRADLLDFGEAEDDGPPGATTVEIALLVLRAVKKELTAAEIVREATERGNPLRYHTVYKALIRHARRKSGLIYQDGPKFGLNEWKTKGGTTGAAEEGG